MLAYLTSAVVLVSMVTGIGAALGDTDNNDEVWAYQWYLDEPFIMTCNSSKLNATPGDSIEWKTPSEKILSTGYMDDNYEIRNASDVTNMELLIKKVRPELHGVYICSVYSGGSMVPRERMILGINIHEERYKEIFDKYRHNLIVAVIATAVFIVPLATSCFVYHFQFLTPEQKARKEKRKAGHQYSANGGDLPMKSTERIVDGSTEKGGKDGYENPNFSTQL